MNKHFGMFRDVSFIFIILFYVTGVARDFQYPFGNHGLHFIAYYLVFINICFTDNLYVFRHLLCTEIHLTRCFDLVVELQRAPNIVFFVSRSQSL